jgi:hypothetical protein
MAAGHEDVVRFLVNNKKLKLNTPDAMVCLLLLLLLLFIYYLLFIILPIYLSFTLCGANQSLRRVGHLSTVLAPPAM